MSLLDRGSFWGVFKSAVNQSSLLVHCLLMGWVAKRVMELLNRFKTRWPAVLYTRDNNCCKYTYFSEQILT